MRPPITIRGADRAVKNTDRGGKVMDGKWFVRIGKRAREFTEADWAKDGLAWVSAQIAGGDLPSAKNPRDPKTSEEQK